jgi:hypothetical protein
MDARGVEQDGPRMMCWIPPALSYGSVSVMGGEGDGTLRSGTEKGVECWKHRFASFEAVLNYI